MRGGYSPGTEGTAIVEMLEPEYEVMFHREERYWWYRGMRRITESFVPDLFALPAGSLVLDAACGTGANLAHLLAEAPRLRAVGLDLSAEALRFSARRKLPALVRGSVERLPFRDAHFDAVTCHDALYAVPDDVTALAEMHRVLKPGGRLFVTSPALPSLASEHDRAVSGERRYTKRELEQKLVRAGFRVERISFANSFLLPPIFLARKLRRPSRGAPTSDFHLAPGPLNGVLTAVLTLEAWLLKRVGLPLGVTLLASARRG